MMPTGRESTLGMRNSIMVTLPPSTLMGPILLTDSSVNQSELSGPAEICNGWELGVGMENSVMLPSGVIRPILFVLYSVNHSAPSGPGVIPYGRAPDVRREYSVI